MTIFGKKLESAREAAGLNQSELARKIGVSSQRISQIESGSGELKIEPFLKALDCLNVGSDYFFPTAPKLVFGRSKIANFDTDTSAVINLMIKSDATGRAIARNHVEVALSHYQKAAPKTKAEPAAANGQ